MDKYVGQSESNLRQIFATARRNAPSVIFFDEFDSDRQPSAAPTPTAAPGPTTRWSPRSSPSWTASGEDQAVLVIGTTNRLDIIDEALLRPSRLRPIEIGPPDYAARRSVASIHAGKFGVDKLMQDLCDLALQHIPAWKATGEIPQPFLDAIFAQHPPYKSASELESRNSSFLRDLQAFFQFVVQAQGEPIPGAKRCTARSSLVELEQRLITIARSYGLDLTRPGQPDLASRKRGRALSRCRPTCAICSNWSRSGSRAGGFSPQTFMAA